MSFVRAPNPIWFMVDLVGLPLNDQYYAFFLTNTLPYLPQSVYEDPQGMNPWPNPLQFFPNGTLPDNLYFDPTLTYRIEIRQGNSQTDPLIYEINNFIAGSGAVPNNSSVLFGAANSISNPQFAEILFSPTLTITTAGTYQIAPDWELVLTGGPGTTTVSQLILSGSALQPNNPPYAIEIANSGWGTAILQQQFNNNGALWNGGSVSMSVLARGVGSNQALALNYVPNSPGTSIPIVPLTVVTTGNFQVLAGAVNIPSPSTNTTPSNNAFVDMQIVLPVSGTVDISNVQVIGQEIPLPASFNPVVDIPPFQEVTYESVVNNLFHDYRESLVREQKNSILVGWNFPLNPWQFSSTASTNVAANEYGPDQTIIIQQNYVATATGNNIAIGQATFVDNFNLKITAVGANNEFGILQYIDPISIRPYWGETLSSLVKAYITTSHSSSVAFKMRLIYSTTVPAQASTAQNVPVQSWALNGDPVFSAGFTAIIPENDPSYILSAESQDMAFEGFVLPASTANTMTLGIFLYTINNMDQTATADSIFINDVSLTNNDFAIATQSQSFDEVLSQCQYYYEKSLATGTLPSAANTVENTIFSEQYALNNGTTSTGYIKGFSYRYNTIKRSAPTVTFYNTSSGAAGAIFLVLTNGSTAINSASIAIGQWALIDSNTKGYSYKSNQTTAAITQPDAVNAFPEAYITYHFTADSTIG